MKYFLNDHFLARLIQGATLTDWGFPTIEPWMVIDDPPPRMVPWDKRRSEKRPEQSCVCFYCSDRRLAAIPSDPDRRLLELRQFHSVAGLDLSPFDNMPFVLQMSQIYWNLAVTHFWGRLGIKVLPNLRLGDERTYPSLRAYPRGSWLAVGTHGFFKDGRNRLVFSNELHEAVRLLRPKGLCVYGTAPDSVFKDIKDSGVLLRVYEPYMDRRWRERHEGRR